MKWSIKSLLSYFLEMKVKWKAKASLPNYSISELASDMFVKKTKNIKFKVQQTKKENKVKVVFEPTTD